MHVYGLETCRQGYVIRQLRPNGSNPVNNKQYQDINKAYSDADELGIKISGVGSCWELIGVYRRVKQQEKEQDHGLVM